MMKILYIASLGGESSGVRAKILNQCQQINITDNTVHVLPINKDVAIDHELKKFCPNNLVSLYKKYYKKQIHFIKKVIALWNVAKIINSNKYDYILYRVQGRRQFYSLLFVKSKIIGIFESIYENEVEKNLINNLKFFLLKKILFRKFSAFIGVTKEIVKHYERYFSNKISLIFPNSIKKIHNTEEDIINKSKRIVAIGSMNKWHGFDRIIPLMNNKKMENFELRIIGAGRESDELKYYKIGSNVKFLGIINKGKLHKELSYADVGIASLALHRIDLKEACPLKTREYLSFGLPIVIGYDDPDISEDCDFVLKVPANEEPIDPDKFLSFYHKVKNIDYKKRIKNYILKNNLLLSDRINILINFLKSI